jgi:maltooligosyltrehalose trehalohydrolase
MATTTKRAPGQNVAIARRWPIGAETTPAGVAFRIWAPKASAASVTLADADRRPSGDSAELRPERDGYFAGTLQGIGAGALYAFSLDGSETLYPDPASRFQPFGPHGPSQVVDPQEFRWTDNKWRGLRLRGQVFYELHVGTFTPEGTWQAAALRLPELAELGITAIEVMPIADFPGKFGWGYDGVNMFAPTRLYGTPDDFRAFVNRAHELGIGVLLDVVYNHFGPDGNYLGQFSDSYLKEEANDWGRIVNFDGRGSAGVREFVIMNAGYWIEEFHLDGLRLDATQDIHDTSETHILAEIGRAVREASGGRETIVVAENEPQETRLVRPLQEQGYGLDGLWNDDFHHTAHVALTGKSEAYFTDYRGQPQELLSAVKHGYLYQGQYYSWQKKRRGTSTRGLAPEAFVVYLENHDQVSNTGMGLRLHQLASPGCHRALTALLLLGPNTPLLFQGQEFSSSRPFLFFADHHPELAKAVRSGRAEFLTQFPSLANPEAQSRLADPADPDTYRRCQLDHSERASHAAAYALHRDLLRLRRDEPAFRAQQPGGFDGAVLGPEAFALRFFAESKTDERLLIINLGVQLSLNPAPEPLLAPPADLMWDLLWSSEDPRYGGSGAQSLARKGAWQLPGLAALVLRPVSCTPDEELDG